MDLHKLAEYQLWANNRVRDLLIGLSEKEFNKDLLPPRGSIRSYCLHIILAVEYSLRKYVNEEELNPNEIGEMIFKMPINVMMEQWKLIDLKFLNFSTSNPELDALFPNFLGKGTMNVNHDDFFIQYLIHTAYHRSQIMSAMRKLGREGVGTDYVFFLSSLHNKEPNNS